MEGRVHAQNDEFGHSRVDTHIPPWSAHMHALKHAHTHTTHTHRKAATNVPMSWSLDRRSLSEPTVLVWLFSQHSDKMLLETMWLPAVVKAKVTGVNTTQIALEIKMTCWIFFFCTVTIFHQHKESFESSRVVVSFLTSSHTLWRVVY